MLNNYFIKFYKICFIVLLILIKNVMSKKQKENDMDVELLLPLPPVNKTLLRHSQTYKFNHGIILNYNTILDIDASYNVLLDVITLVIFFWIFITIIFCRYNKYIHKYQYTLYRKISNYLAITPRNIFEKEILTKNEYFFKLYYFIVFILLLSMEHPVY